MLPTVMCVLRSGGEYRLEHVVRLYEGVRTHWPDALRFVVLTDRKIGHAEIQEVPLAYGWPGWWSKCELFRPDLPVLGDVLYFDLDTVVVGDLAPLAEGHQVTVLRDFYHRGLVARRGWIGSGLMYLPAASRAEVWLRWIASPDVHMTRCRQRGDQGFLELCWNGREDVVRWQDVLPGQVVSAKVHVFPGRRIPTDARVVCFHGKPRPEDAPQWFWEEVRAPR